MLPWRGCTPARARPPPSRSAGAVTDLSDPAPGRQFTEPPRSSSSQSRRRSAVRGACSSVIFVPLQCKVACKVLLILNMLSFPCSVHWMDEDTPTPRDRGRRGTQAPRRYSGSPAAPRAWWWASWRPPPSASSSSFTPCTSTRNRDEGSYHVDESRNYISNSAQSNGTVVKEKPANSAKNSGKNKKNKDKEYYV
ncbi:hypothetical protein SKAU_G00162810 [Synaphobranchus kaupii]|uniref:Uncharacterized protein n=1 Tax=Synaphobranchus kaupii TaxID=118154 RepID=A0A9Q1FIZ4_SYNKA|nr:hypothetical protein SKAU_G00162810 [Synaphobranchus kaupii]